MASYKLIWIIKQGDTLLKTFTLYERATPQAAKVPINLTGASILIQIRSTVADDGGSTLLTFSTSNGRITTPTSDGKVIITFSDLTTLTGTGMPALDGAFFDIQVTFPGGQTRTFPGESIGLVKLSKEVTR